MLDKVKRFLNKPRIDPLHLFRVKELLRYLNLRKHIQ